MKKKQREFVASRGTRENKDDERSFPNRREMVKEVVFEHQEQKKGQ